MYVESSALHCDTERGSRLKSTWENMHNNDKNNVVTMSIIEILIKTVRTIMMAIIIIVMK